VKITVRKRLGAWFVSIPGDVPDFSKHRHWTDAIAKVHFEVKNILASRNRKLYAV